MCVSFSWFWVQLCVGGRAEFHLPGSLSLCARIWCLPAGTAQAACMVTCCHMWYGLSALFLVWPSWFWAIMLIRCVQKIVLGPLTGNEMLILRGGIGTHTQQGSWGSSSLPTREQPPIEYRSWGWEEGLCPVRPGVSGAWVLPVSRKRVCPRWLWRQWCHCGTDLLTVCFFKSDCLNGVFVGSWWEWRCF